MLRHFTFLIVLGLLLAPATARAENVLRFATIAPAASPWGQVLRVWQRAVRERSNNQLDIRFYWNGTQGDENAMVGKIKSGQLDGAAVTALGLSRIHKPILALQLPGMFKSWQQLDTVRESLRGEFQSAALANSGMQIVGWGDVGHIRMFSQGFAIAGPESLRGSKPFLDPHNDIGRVMFSSIGGVTPVVMSVPEVLPGLTSARINVVAAPSLGCEQLQWAARLDHVVADTSTMLIGAMVMANQSIERLSADERTIMEQTGRVASEELTRRIRAEDDASWKRLSGRMTVHSLSTDEKAAWTQLFQQIRRRLAQQGVFSQELIDRVEKSVR